MLDILGSPIGGQFRGISFSHGAHLVLSAQCFQCALNYIFEWTSVITSFCVRLERFTCITRYRGVTPTSTDLQLEIPKTIDRLTARPWRWSWFERAITSLDCHGWCFPQQAISNICSFDLGHTDRWSVITVQLHVWASALADTEDSWSGVSDILAKLSSHKNIYLNYSSPEAQRPWEFQFHDWTNGKVIAIYIKTIHARIKLAESKKKRASPDIFEWQCLRLSFLFHTLWPNLRLSTYKIIKCLQSWHNLLCCPNIDDVQRWPNTFWGRDGNLCYRSSLS